MAEKTLYRVKFRSEDKMYEIYADSVYQADLIGFIAIEGLRFSEPGTNSVIANPSEERMREEFADTEVLLLPMHSIFRVDVVKAQGMAKIVQLDPQNQVSQNIIFPSSKPGDDSGSTS